MTWKPISTAPAPPWYEDELSGDFTKHEATGIRYSTDAKHNNDEAVAIIRAIRRMGDLGAYFWEPYAWKEFPVPPTDEERDALIGRGHQR